MATQTLRVGMALAGFQLVKPADSQAPAHAPPVRYQVSIDKNGPSTMRDGTVLGSDIHHPRAPGRFPALPQRTPYSKNDARASEQFGELAGRGFVVVIQDTRGRYMSDGEARPHDEAQDGFDNIAWVARLSYANRKVGMFGGSYLATTQLLAATLKPPALVALHYAHKICDLLRDAATWAVDYDGHRIVTVNVEKSKALAEEIATRTEVLERRIDENVERGRWPDASSASFNDRLTHLEQALLHESGSPAQRWYVIYGWNIYSLYDGQPLPGLAEAIRSKDPARVAQETARSEYALRRRRAGLRQAGD